MLKRPWLFWLGGIIAAWLVDFLFWKSQPGITVLVWALILIIGSVIIIWKEGVKPSWINILAMIAALGMATIMAFRREPFTNFVAFCLMFLAIFLVTFSYKKAYWIFYRVRDHIKAAVLLLVGFLGRAGTLKKDQASAAALPSVQKNTRQPKKETAPPPLPETQKPARPPKRIWAIVRGILFAIPILSVLAALLASADLAFANRLQEFLELLRIEKLPEYLFRLTYILILGYFFTGTLLHAGFPRKPESIPDETADAVKPFLGWIESIIILGAVELLFLFFVILQFQYLFGAQSNISFEGFTFSEYARRGFFELVTVAVLSLLIYVVLSAITRRENSVQKMVFTGLIGCLFVLVLIILVSSFQRLSLYEGAYGFSRLRTYTHFFIFWLAGLFILTLILEVIGKKKIFMLANILCVFGFGLTLAGINVDEFIARQNILLSKSGMKLDGDYLAQLSIDAVPYLVQEYSSGQLSKETRNIIGADLACRMVEQPQELERNWKSFHLGEWMAEAALQKINNDLGEFNLRLENGWWKVTVNGEERECIGYYVWD